ncbi:MAG: alpha-hydroxy acid oxidase, partial [Dehalococcoidia bacterium]|nr:alpha-hydroxy acid oxidase [Dehalococcoidia bacterium]
AVGMDIDHFYGVLMEDRAIRTDLFAPQFTAEIKQVMATTKLPFIIKGVLSLSDAEKAVQLGASAIVVSNHGSGSLEFGLPSMVALPEIVEAVGNRVTVLVDTGFETGNDVFKGLALGAKAVGLASPVILAWCADGAQGVELLINQVTAEMQRTMAATGCANVAAINGGIIRELPFTM